MDPSQLPESNFHMSMKITDQFGQEVNSQAVLGMDEGHNFDVDFQS